MSAPTVPEVCGWRTGPLLEAADRLSARAAEVEDAAVVVRRSLDDAVEVGGGAWARTAQGRAASESRTGLALADGLTAAAGVLRSGAPDLGAARDRLLRAVERAASAGWPVTPEGRVETLRPPLETAGDMLDPELAGLRRQQEEERAGHEQEVRIALAAAEAAEESLAARLEDLPFPETLRSLSAAYVARTRLLDDRVAALGTAGGAVVLGRAARDGLGLVRKGAQLHDYLSTASSVSKAEQLEKLRTFAFGGGKGNLARRAGGKAFLPLTILDGARDAFTGGGHDGARGWATRGFGAAGAVGAVGVMAAAMPVLVVPVVGVGIAGAAVLAYGAWTAGSYLVDHWDQVEALDDAVDEWSAERAEEVGDAVDGAVDWAHDQLADVGAGALDAIDDLF